MVQKHQTITNPEILKTVYFIYLSMLYTFLN